MKIPNPISSIVIYSGIAIFGIWLFMAYFHIGCFDSISKKDFMLSLGMKLKDVYFWSIYVILMGRLFIYQRVQLGKDGLFFRKQGAYLDGLLIYFCFIFNDYYNKIGDVYVLPIAGMFFFLNLFVIYYLFLYKLLSRVFMSILFIGMCFFMYDDVVVAIGINSLFNNEYKWYLEIVIYIIISIFIIIGNRKLQEAQSKSVAEGTKEPPLSPQ